MWCQLPVLITLKFTSWARTDMSKRKTLCSMCSSTHRLAGVQLISRGHCCTKMLVALAHWIHLSWAMLKPIMPLMASIYIVPLSKALHNWCFSFAHSHTHTHTHTHTHSHTHQQQLAAMQGTNQLVTSNWGLGVLPWDNPPTARRLLLPPEPSRPHVICTVTVPM